MSPRKSPTTYVALLRGINLSGRRIVPMSQLAQLFASTGCTDVRTLIQSGNVVFKSASDAAALSHALQQAIEKQFGFAVPVVLRTAAQLGKIISNNPYLPAGAPEKSLHVYFLAEAPAAEAIAALDPNRSVPDAFQVIGQEIYLHLPNGMGQSKLTNAYFDSKLKTICTARNWATILKLANMMPS